MTEMVFVCLREEVEKVNDVEKIGWGFLWPKSLPMPRHMGWQDLGASVATGEQN